MPAPVVLDIIARDKFTAPFAKAGAEAEALGKKVSATSGKIAAAAKFASTVAIAGAVAVVTASVKLASQFEDSQARLQAALKASGSSADALKTPIAAANKRMEAFGFTNTDTADAIANLTVATRNPTKAIKELGLAADLARFKNIPLAEAATAVGKAMAGNLRPIKQLGIDLPVAAGGAVKLANANAALGKAQDKYNLVLDVYHRKPTAANALKVHAALLKVHDAQSKVNSVAGAANVILATLSQRLGGQAQAAAGTMAGRVQVLRARLEDMGIRIGTALIPPLMTLVAWIGQAVTWMQRHSTLVKIVAGVLLGLAIGFKVVSVAVAIFNAVLAANPIVWIIALIAGLVVGIVYAYTHFKTFRNIVQTAWAVIQVAAQVAWRIIKPILDLWIWEFKAVAAVGMWFYQHVIVPVFTAVAWYVQHYIAAVIVVFRALQTAWNATWHFIASVGGNIINWFKALPGNIWNWIKGLPGTLLSLGQQAITALWNGIKAEAHLIWEWFKGLPGTIWNQIKQGPAGMLWRLGQNLINDVKDGLENAFHNVLNWFKDLPKKILHAAGFGSAPGWAIQAGKWIIQGLAEGMIKAPAKLAALLAGKVGLGAARGLFGTGAAMAGTDVRSAQIYAASLVQANWARQDEMDALVNLWNNESGWRWNALNASSGAYGIPQSLPADKMASAGADWRTNASTQIRWGLNYIKSVYGDPINAWNQWQARSPNWYKQGAWNIARDELAYLHRGEMVVPEPQASQVRSAGRGGTQTVELGPRSLRALAEQIITMDGEKVARLVTKRQTAEAVRGGRR